MVILLNNCFMSGNGRKLLRLGFEGFPFRNNLQNGPDIFMQRLSRIMVEKKLVKLRNPRWPFYDIGLFKILSKSRYNKPFILRLDGIYVDKANTVGDSDELNEIIFKSITTANGLIFISNFSKELVTKFYGQIKKPSTIIHNSVDINQFSPSGGNYRKKLGINANSKVIITSAQWRRPKRLKETVIFFKKMVEHTGEDLKLIVLGKNPDYVIDNNNIFYVGEVPFDDLPGWYRTGDIYIQLSWLEPCGNTQIEAIACGLPTLCTNRGGIRETIIRSKGGIVSAADESFEFKKIDIYNPPEPDYNILIKDMCNILENISFYQKRIDYQKVDINLAAREYIDFIERIYSS
jgi:glycosyltransferase involved in cell wall biosynthesis